MASHSFIDQSDLGLTGSVFDLKVNDTILMVRLDRRWIVRAARARIDPGEKQPNPGHNERPLLFDTVDHYRGSFIGHVVAMTKRLRQR